VKVGDLVIPMYGKLCDTIGIVTNINAAVKYCSVYFPMEAGRRLPFLCCHLDVISELP
jgi:hypothetical protein